jgi:hypothetical protein
MSAQNDLEMDNNGNIVTRPVLGWTTVPAMGTAVILAIQYAETPQELKTGGRRLQLVLTPQQAQELAATLTTQAARVLSAPGPDRPPN